MVASALLIHGVQIGLVQLRVYGYIRWQIQYDPL